MNWNTEPRFLIRWTIGNLLKLLSKGGNGVCIMIKESDI